MPKNWTVFIFERWLVKITIWHTNKIIETITSVSTVQSLSRELSKVERLDLMFRNHK